MPSASKRKACVIGTGTGTGVRICIARPGLDVFERCCCSRNVYSKVVIVRITFNINTSGFDELQPVVWPKMDSHNPRAFDTKAMRRHADLDSASAISSKLHCCQQIAAASAVAAIGSPSAPN